MNPQLLVRRSAIGDGLTVIAFAGEVDMASAGEFTNALSVESAESGTLVVDLCSVTFLAAAGLHALVALRRRCQERGGALWITTRSPGVRVTVKAAGLSMALPVVAELPSVLAERVRASLDSEMAFGQACGALMAREDLDAEEAALVPRLRARRAQIDPAAFARQVLCSLPHQREP